MTVPESADAAAWVSRAVARVEAGGRDRRPTAHEPFEVRAANPDEVLY